MYMYTCTCIYMYMYLHVHVFTCTCITQSTVLKRREGQWYVNIHSSIPTMLEEAKWMQRLGLQVPETVHQLSVSNVRSNYDQLKVQ